MNIVNEEIVILSTCESEADARRLASHLVERRLAACVNLLPGATSVYRWKGAVETASEWMLIIKSQRRLVAAIEEEFKTVHPYEVPELIVVPIVAGSEPYLAWLRGELRPE